MTHHLSFLTATAFAGVAYGLGHVLVRRFPGLERNHVPEPVLGGLAFALLFLLLRGAGVTVEFPTSGRPLDFLVALLTTNMGLHVTPRALREGWRPFVVFLLAAAGLFLLQLLVALPWALLTETPLRTALVAPMSLMGAPFNLNPPAQVEPIRHLFLESHPDLREVAQGVMMIGVLLGVTLTGVLGRRLLRRAGEEPPEPPREATGVREDLAGLAREWTFLVALILLLISLAFLAQERLLRSFARLEPDHLPVIVLAYASGALFRLGFERWAGEARFPGKSLDVLLLGPTMGLVLGYALMSLPLHHLGRVTPVLAAAAVLGIGCSVLASWLLFPLFARLTGRYDASVIVTAFLALTTAWGAVGMGHVRFFMREEGPVKPMPVVMPLNAFFLFPWLVIFLTQALLRLFG